MVALIPGLRTQRQMVLCEFKATLNYLSLIQKQIRVMVHTFNPSVWESHTFNPSTREVGIEVVWLSRERNIKGKRLTQVWSLRICEDRVSSFWSEDLAEVKGFSGGWLLCFSDLHLEPQYLSLICATGCYTNKCALFLRDFSIS